MCSDGDVTAPERKTSNSGSDPPLLQSPGGVCDVLDECDVCKMSDVLDTVMSVKCVMCLIL
jgi:hypothetical protein